MPYLHKPRVLFVFGRPTTIFEAVVLSSFGKLIVILMVIWNYYTIEYAWMIQAFVLASNVEALFAISFTGQDSVSTKQGNERKDCPGDASLSLLMTPYRSILLITLVGHLSRWFLQCFFSLSLDSSYPINVF